MVELITILVLLVVVGPLAVWFGKDSRPTERDTRRWWPGSPRS